MKHFSTFSALACSAIIVLVAGLVSAAYPPVPSSCNGGHHNFLPVANAVDTMSLIGVHPSGKLYVANPGPDNFTVLHMFGKTAYDNGLAHGTLLKAQINAILPLFVQYIEKEINESTHDDLPPALLKWLATVGIDLALDLTATWTRPFTPQYYIDELHGIADGAGVTFNEVYRLFLVPELMKAACTVVGAYGSATTNGKVMHLRGLDFGFFPIRDFPMISVYHFSQNPIGGNTRDVAVFGWIILNVGALTGFSSDPATGNALSVGEKVLLKYGKNIDGVTGTPWMLLLRDMLGKCNTVNDAVQFLREANRTCAIHVGIGDTATNSFQGVEMAAHWFANYTWNSPGMNWTGHPYIKDTFYWNKHMQDSHDPCLADLLQSLYGNVTAYNLVQVSAISTTGNLHSVAFDLANQTAYFANARKQGDTVGPKNAFERQYTLVDMKYLFNMRQ